MKVIKLSALIFIQIKANGFLTKIRSLHVVTVIMLVLAAILFAPNVCANIYSWTDSNGVKHFSNVPPPPDVFSVVDVKREEVYDKGADEARWELEKKEWDSLKQELEETEKQEPTAIEAGRGKKESPTGMEERIEREKFMLQTQIARLENTVASSFSGQLDGKRAAIAFYRTRLKMLEEEPDKYFDGP